MDELLEGCLFTIAATLGMTAVVVSLVIAADIEVLKGMSIDIAIGGLQVMAMVGIIFSILYHAIYQD